MPKFWRGLGRLSLRVLSDIGHNSFGRYWCYGAWRSLRFLSLHADASPSSKLQAFRLQRRESPSQAAVLQTPSTLTVSADQIPKIRSLPVSPHERATGPEDVQYEALAALYRRAALL